MPHASQLAAFLSDTISDSNRLSDQGEISLESQAEWLRFLGQHLGLIGVPTNSGDGAPENFLLLIATHPEFGVMLLKSRPSLLRERTVYAFIGATGETYFIGHPADEKLGTVNILFETFAVEDTVDAVKMARFIHKPIFQLLRQTSLLVTLATFLSSVLFLVNYNVLAFVVPSLSSGALGALSILVAILLFSTLLSLYVTNLTTLYTNSVASEREEVLRLSLMWALRPSFLFTRSPERALEFCKIVAGTGRKMYETIVAAISSLVLIPIFVLLFMRLPSSLFVFVVAVAVVDTVVQARIGLWLREREQRLNLSQSDNQNFLYGIIGAGARIKFYEQVDRYLGHWRAQQTEYVREKYSIDRTRVSLGVLRSVLTSLSQLAAILAITMIVASHSDGEGNGFEVADGYIIMHLVLAMYQFGPRIAMLAERWGSIRVDLRTADALLIELREGRKKRSSKVTSLSTKVECSDLMLAHGCAFSPGEPLTLSIEGRQVVQITGESGAGKTTFLRTLLGCEKPASGAISVFGANPINLSPMERARIFGYVSQSVQLLPGSLRDNLNLFAAEPTDERAIWNALERVDLHERLLAMPLRLDTPIADARRGFSTGERQRIVLAQAILKKSAILVLDEAMSGLPPEQEIEVFSRIRELFTQVFYVSHRAHMSDAAEMFISLRAPVLA